MPGPFARAQAPEDRDALQDLTAKLAHFYAEPGDYFDAAEGSKERFYDALRPFLKGFVNKGKVARILEVGAGRTAFRSWLHQAFPDLAAEFVVQDITPANAAFLAKAADRSVIGSLAELADREAESFDLIFSTFVFEHVVDPHRFLDQSLVLLRPGGTLAIFCPMYIMPAYRPPALRHRPKLWQYWTSIKLGFGAFVARLTGRVDFLIVREPALLAGSRHLDADAIHLVRPGDARRHLKGRATPLRLSVRTRGLRDFLWRHLALLAVAYQKTPPKTSGS